jgi:hypothetical protein
MRIAFDLDGVLADLHTPFTETAIRLFPQLDRSAMRAPDVGASPGDDALDSEAPTVASMAGVALNRRQSDAVWKHLAGVSDFWEGLSEIESGRDPPPGSTRGRTPMGRPVHHEPSVLRRA